MIYVMGSTKRLWEEKMLERAEAPMRNEIAERLDLSLNELSEIDYEINVDQNSEGMIYGHYVNFGEDTDPEILERLGAEDGTLYLEHSYAEDVDYDYEEELRWESESEEHFKIFRDTADNICSLSRLEVPEDSRFSLRVMLFMHAVSAMERLLQSTFLHEVTKSQECTQKFVENDRELKERPISLGRIFEAQDKLEVTVRNRIGEILFHNIRQVAGLYHSVLGLQLGNVKWLSVAVLKRHDCAHRAGYTKNGKKIELVDAEIRGFLNSCLDLASKIEVYFRIESEDSDAPM